MKTPPHWILVVSILLVCGLSIGCLNTGEVVDTSADDDDDDDDNDNDDVSSDADSDSDTDTGVEPLCSSCHSSLPPNSEVHTVSDHDRYSCNDSGCHGDVVNSSGTTITNDSLHQDGQSQASCDNCH